MLLGFFFRTSSTISSPKNGVSHFSQVTGFGLYHSLCHYECYKLKPVTCEKWDTPFFGDDIVDEVLKKKPQQQHLVI